MAGSVVVALPSHFANQISSGWALGVLMRSIMPESRLLYTPALMPCALSSCAHAERKVITVLLHGPPVGLYPSMSKKMGEPTGMPNPCARAIASSAACSPWELALLGSILIVNLELQGAWRPTYIGIKLQ